MAKKFIVKAAADECKGCGRCVLACRRGVLVMGKKLNAMGYAAVTLSGEVCIGCGMCFYTCPEPGALTIIEECGDEQ